MATVAVSLSPVDTLFFRDGRGFDATMRPTSTLPMPQTLAGAVRTWLLRRHGVDFALLSELVRGGTTPEDALRRLGEPGEAAAGLRVAGPWLARHRDGGVVEPLLPVPADLARPKGRDALVRLKPLERAVPGWQGAAAGLRPLWHAGVEATEPADGLLDGDSLAEYLAGGTPHRLIDVEALLGSDHRTGIAIDDARGTVMSGMLYATTHLALAAGVCFYAELELHDSHARLLPSGAEVLPWGGEGRRASMEPCPIWAWPPPPSGGRGHVVLLTAPGLFAAGWRPAGLNPAAAAVRTPVAVSGWDMARGGPKPTRFAAPAGSVYYVEADAATGPVPPSLCDDPADARLGFGTCLRGVWPA